MTLRSSALLFAKGLAMGAADVVPGISGGTIAFVTGIYDELLNSIKSCTPAALTILFRQGVRPFWQHINGTFLVTLFAGILTSLFTLAGVVTWLLQAYPILVWSFFFGLVLVSSWHVGKTLDLRNLPAAGFLVLGAGLAWWISGSAPADAHDASLLMYFGVGALAICAMILPGISGSFILLLLGYYSVVMAAVKTLDVPVLAVFAAGCVTGLLVFSRLLSWLLLRAKNMTIAFLAGLMIGSLNKLWPWKEVLATRINSKGIEVALLEHNIGPWRYEMLTGEPALIAGAFFCAAAAVFLVLGLDWLAARYK